MRRATVGYDIKRLTREEQAHKAKFAKVQAAKADKQRRRERAERMDKERADANATAQKKILAEVRADTARKARIAKAIADDEQRTGPARKGVLI
jgi:hypothetical protein